ncbi:hypothetical protein G6514_008256 [Epicoccum nigrum]|nr:hypothetical protein G6514_008256 [Epicoccum nigrum]
MEVVTQRHLEWTEPTPSASSDPSASQWHDEWNAFRSATEQTLDVFPHSLEDDSFGMMEHFNNKEQNPSKRLRGSFDRDTSIPVEHLLHEALWPEQQQPGSFHQERRPSPSGQDTSLPMLGDAHTDKEALHYATELDTSRPQAHANPGIVKRKRGRPRLHPSPSDFKITDISYENLSASRIMQLEKNRLAAEKCRQKRKVYTAGLSAEMSALSTKNETLKADVVALREELLNLKNEILGHARCGSLIIDGYIAKSAGSQLTPEKEKHALPRRDSGQGSSSGRSDCNQEEHTPGSEFQTPVMHGQSKFDVGVDSYAVFENFHDLVNTEEH